MNEGRPSGRPSCDGGEAVARDGSEAQTQGEGVSAAGTDANVARADRPEAGERRAPDAAHGVSAFLYDADGDDREMRLEEVVVDELREDDLIWLDLNLPEPEALTRLNELVSLELPSFPGGERAQPAIRDFGDQFVLRVLPAPGDHSESQAASLVCAVGRNWLATVHDGDIASLEGFADHVRGDSAMGRLDAPSFLARLLEWVLNSYFDELDRLQGTIDDLEERILRARGDRRERGVVQRLVDLRHDIGKLRRRLSPHRQVFAVLSHPSFDVISGSDSAREFEVLVDRLETAIETADTTREMLVGAFDVHMTQTAQRTNDIMRVLTTVSLMLLPATVIAGTMGMNMLPEYLLHSWVFWAAIVAMVVVSVSVLVTMRWRRWL